MTSKLTKYGLMIIGAVLLITLAFAGAASAGVVEISSNEWNLLTADQVKANTSYHFNNDGTESIKSKGDFGGLTKDLTLDFSGYTGGFAGGPVSAGNNNGALFGFIGMSGYTLKIIGLNMTDIIIQSGREHLGGLIGHAAGGSGTVVFTDCHLSNCTISSSHSAGYVGGFLGCNMANGVTCKITDCSINHSTITSAGPNVGGFIGQVANSDFDDGCIVENCTISGTQQVGGLIGYTNNIAEFSATKDARIKVSNSSIYASSSNAGGLSGDVGKYIPIDIAWCEVHNCVVKSPGNNVAGLITWTGSDTTYQTLISDCSVMNSTISGASKVGGFIAVSDKHQTQFYDGDSLSGTAVKGGAETNYYVGVGTYSGSVTQVGKNWIQNTTQTIPVIVVSSHTETYPTDIPSSATIVTQLSSIGAKNDEKKALGYVWKGSYGGEVSSDEWNQLSVDEIAKGGTYTFNNEGTEPIQPKDSITLSASLTLDFTGYTGGFTGVQDGTGNAGALFGTVNTEKKLITIKNLTLDTITVSSTSQKDARVGGIIGRIDSGSTSYNYFSFINCHIINSTILANSTCGGLVGYASSGSFESCSVISCNISGNVGGAGGIAGYVSAIQKDGYHCSIEKCAVENCLIVGSTSAGGAVGSSNAFADAHYCSIKNCSIISIKLDAGGLIGNYPNFGYDIDNNRIENCVVIGGEGTGGLIGKSSSMHEATGVMHNLVLNCTIQSLGKNKGAGGFAGYMSQNVSSSSHSLYYTRNNTVQNCAIRGNSSSSDYVNLICGYSFYSKWWNFYSIYSTATGVNYLQNTSTTVPMPIVVALPNINEFPEIPEGGIIVTQLSGIGVPSKPMKALGYVLNVTPLVFDPSNGSEITSFGMVHVADNTITFEEPVYPGYVFNGWNMSSPSGPMLTDAEGNLVSGVDDYTNVSGYWINNTGIPVTLYANWTANETLLNLKDASGSVFATRIETFGVYNETPVPSFPIKEGYTFNGWNLSENPDVQLINETGYILKVAGYTNATTGAWENSTLENNAELDLVSCWVNNTYTVVFHSNNGTDATAEQEFTYDEPQNLDQNTFTYRGYAFVNWSTDAAGTGTNYTDGQEVINLTGDPDGIFDLYAQWKGNVTTITLDPTVGAGGTAMVNATFNSSSLNTTITNPYLKGYTLVGWNLSTDVELIDAAGHLNAGVAGYTTEDGKWNNTDAEVVVYANWTLKDYMITILPAVGGSGQANKTEYLHIGDEVRLNVTNATGYSFVSWNSTDAMNFTNSTDPVYLFTMPATSLVIAPNFEVTNVPVIPDPVSNTAQINASIVPVGDAPLVVVYRLENVSDTIQFVADSGDAGIPSSASTGYQDMKVFGTFQITKTPGESGMSKIVVNVTLNSSAEAGSIYLKHCTGLIWDDSHIVPAGTPTDLGNNVYQFVFETDSFSPFAVISETAVPQPQSSGSSSSHNTGYTIILSDGQVTPTVSPTAVPTAATPTVVQTAKPTTQATQQSPAPFVGLLAGLGAAAVLLRLRK